MLFLIGAIVAFASWVVWQDAYRELAKMQERRDYGTRYDEVLNTKKSSAIGMLVGIILLFVGLVSCVASL